MTSYRIVLQRTVVTHEFFVVQADDEDEAIENATNGSWPVVSSDLQESSTEVMTAEELK